MTCLYVDSPKPDKYHFRKGKYSIREHIFSAKVAYMAMQRNVICYKE